ncbi:MAG: hypothetical protein QM767_07220 [Anaeromyxobacter sp.]
MLLLDPRGRRLLRTPWPWLGVVLALALFSPVLFWNAARSGASFAFQTGERVAHSGFRPQLLGRYLGLQAAIVTPLALGLLVEGLVQAARRWREPAFRICALFGLPLLCLATVIAPFHWVKMNWLAAVYPTALIAAAALALASRDAARASGRRPWRWWLGGAGLGLALVGSVYLHAASASTAVPLPYKAKDDLSSGWTELAARVEAERRAAGPDAFVAGCSYKVSAELGYYLPGRPRTWSNEITGDPGLQYRYWFDSGRAAGADRRGHPRPAGEGLLPPPGGGLPAPGAAPAADGDARR